MLKYWLILAVSFLFATRAIAENHPEDNAAVRHVVSEYIAAWRAGDTERLGRIFDLDHGYVIWVSGEGAAQEIRSRTFRKLLENRKANPGYGDPYRIENLDIIDGQLAVVKFALNTDGGSYVDHFTLYKRLGEWKIVTKTYVWRPGVSLPDE